jgi:hypothetical protein
MKIRPRRKTIPANNRRITARGIEIINQNNPIRKICLGVVGFFLGADKPKSRASVFSEIIS